MEKIVQHIGYASFLVLFDEQAPSLLSSFASLLLDEAADDSLVDVRF